MKTALITGGTSGVGLSVAKGLLQREYSVYLIGKSVVRGKTIASTLNAPYPGNAVFIHLDLSHLHLVKRFSQQFVRSHYRLDLLANIAGVIESERQLTEEGFERSFAIGYLSAFVPSTRLSEALERAPRGRIVNVSGWRYLVFREELDFEDMTFSKRYDGFQADLKAIHAKTVLTQILSEKYRAREIDVNSFYPGVVRSDLYRTASMPARAVDRLVSPFLSKESKTGIYVASSPDMQGTSGQYFRNRRVGRVLDFAPSYRARLWQESVDMLERI